MSAQQPAHRSLLELQHGVVYRAPSGRLCTLHPRSTGRRQAGHALLLYVTEAGTPAAVSSLDGFWLSSFNWYLLRRAG